MLAFNTNLLLMVRKMFKTIFTGESRVIYPPIVRLCTLTSISFPYNEKFLDNFPLDTHIPKLY